MRFASAMSEHPLTSHAVGEVTGQVLEAIGEHPDLALLFVTAPHGGALEDAAAAVMTLLEPSVLLGCAAESVAATGREVETSAAVSLWAGQVGLVKSLELRASERVGRPEWASAAGPDDGQPSSSGDDEAAAGWAPVAGWPGQLAFEARALLLFADPFSFPAQEFLAWMDTHHPGVPVIGGMASGAKGPGGTRLAVNGEIRDSGAVGALLGPGTTITTVVSQGCRPIGHPMVATRTEGNIVYELAGQPALERLIQLAKQLSEREVSLINTGGLHLGRVIDEHKVELGRGDFLVRSVLGADKTNGAIAVGDVIELGTTVQFHLRDAEAADEDLRSLLAAQHAEAALLFTCNGRGTRMFVGPDHDAKVLATTVGHLPTAGFFAAGEFGPVGGRNFLHGFTASVALLNAS